MILNLLYDHIFHSVHRFNERITLLDEIRDINEDISKQDKELSFRTLIFGESNFSNFKNTNILNSAMEFILATKRFYSPFI